MWHFILFDVIYNLSPLQSMICCAITIIGYYEALYIAYGYAMIKGLTVTVTKNIRLEIPRGRRSRYCLILTVNVITNQHVLKTHWDSAQK